MFRTPWFVRASFIIAACVAFAGAARGADDGQDDLDKATQLKVAAETLDDLAQVIEKLDSAMEKGLDKDNEELAKQMLVSTLMQRGSMFATAVFNIPQQDPQRGMRLMQLRSWALTDLQRALELDNKLVEAQLQIGKLQSLPLGDNNAAKRAFSVVVKDGDATDDQKAEAFALRSALQTDEAKRDEDLNKAVELSPKKPDYLRVRAQYLYGKEKVKEALADIDKALKLEADHAASHVLRGMILLGLEKYDDALSSFNKASELEPKAALPYQHRAELYRKKGDLEKAAEQLTKALELAPNNVATLLIRSTVYFELKQNDKAMADVEQAIKAAPRLAQPYMMRAEILAATDKLDEAIKQLEELSQQAPGNAPILGRLGSFYLMAGRPHKAIETLTQVIQIDPDNFNAWRFRGDAYLNIGQHAEGMAEFDNALALDVEDESVLNTFPWVLATSPDDKVRNGKKAIELATKASEKTGHQTPHILSTLGAAYAESGDFETAKKWSKQAVDLEAKAAEEAKTDEEKAKMKTDLEQLKKEFSSYEAGKPVRERQTAEDAPEKKEKKGEEPAKEDHITPAEKPKDAPKDADSTANS
jgi:tetratricopeptide (TPR) repeat protein